MGNINTKQQIQSEDEFGTDINKIGENKYKICIITKEEYEQLKKHAIANGNFICDNLSLLEAKQKIDNLMNNTNYSKPGKFRILRIS